MNEITQLLLKFRTVEEKFRKIQENSSLYGAENGLTNEELLIFDKLISHVDEMNIAADAILKRY